MKTFLAIVLVFSSLPALACKMTATSYDTYRISEGAKYFSENTQLPSETRVSKVRINKDDLVVIESKLGEQCFVTAYSISPEADCSPKIALVKTMEECE